MSYYYGSRSRRCIATLHPDLERVLEAAIKIRDIGVIEGHRGEEDQNNYFATGRSKVRFPNSKHNPFPSRAFDAVPCPFRPEDWTDREKWVEWSGWLVGFAAAMGVTLRSGIDWDRDHDTHDQTFNDGPHFELVDN